jgi:hypothetical protein
LQENRSLGLHGHGLLSSSLSCILSDIDRSNPFVHNPLNSRLFFGDEQTAAVSEPDFNCRHALAINREVAMNDKADIRIDVEAVRALIDWKSRFADEVASHARQFAAESGQPARVTLSHYRQAAQIAVRSLETAILDGRGSSDDQKAA